MMTIKPGDIDSCRNASLVQQKEQYLMDVIHKDTITNDIDDEWIFVGYLPKQSKLSFVYMLNNENIVNICGDLMFKYNFKQNTWCEYHRFPSQFSINSVALDPNSKTNAFYVNILDNHQMDRKFYRCNLYKDELKIEALNIEPDLCDIHHQNIAFIEHSIVINGEYHIFSLNDTPCLQHLILNQKTKTFSTSYDFPTALTNFGLIYLKKQQRLLLFGGLSQFDGRQKGVTDIYSASFSESAHRWIWCKVSSVQLAAALADVVCIATNDEQHVILFGGCTTIVNDTQNISNESLYEWMECESDDNAVEYKDMNCIYVLDTHTMNIKQSRINCPKRGVFNAVLPKTSSLKVQYLINGFIKTFHDPYVAKDIIRVIDSFYQNEYIHLLDRNGFEKMHWKISVDHILDSL